jgi:UDP-hydrolysing UDP-N-acetyl-D-glucosamine 2-epimerase
MLASDPDFEVQIALGHAALLEGNGVVKHEMSLDGILPSYSFDFLMEGRSSGAMAKTAALGMYEFAGIAKESDPDLVLIRGDRYEVLGLGFAAACLNIPIVHVEGGDVSGNIDDKVRHAVTKLSELHFVTNEASRDRVIQMGEDPTHVHNTGSLEVDTIRIASIEFPEWLFTRYTGVGSKWDPKDGYLLVMQHPVTDEIDKAFEQMLTTLRAAVSSGLGVVCLHPNSDAGADGISKALRVFRESTPRAQLHVFRGFTSTDFLSVLASARCLVGNSSAGVKECAVLGVPSVNVGSRQEGRLRGENVLDCSGNSATELLEAIRSQVQHGPYPPSQIYGDGRAAERMIGHLRSFRAYKKSFQSIERART